MIEIAEVRGVFANKLLDFVQAKLPTCSEGRLRLALSAHIPSKGIEPLTNHRFIFQKIGACPAT